MIEIHLGELVTAALIFLLTLFCLNKILFHPIMKIVKEREYLTSGRLQEADAVLHRYEQLSHQYESSLRTEKTANYKRLEERRKAALGQRAERIAEARKQAEQKVADARSELTGQVEQVKRTLGDEARELAAVISRRILGRDVK